MLLAQNPFKTPEFQDLFKEWNKILSSEGFAEVEDFNLPNAPLKCWHNFKWKNPNRLEEIQETERYYDLAITVAQEFEFKNEVHRHIWDLYCRGFSMRKIAQTINQKKFKKTNIHCIILSIQKKSGLRND